MNLIKLIIPVDAHIKTKRIIGHLIYFLDLDVQNKPIVVASHVTYHDVFARGKLWDEWQINEQNVIEFNNSNNDPVHSLAKMLRVSMDEIEPNFKNSIINYYGTATRLWDFCLARFLKNEFDYSWIESYKGPTNLNSIITFYAKIHGHENINIKEIHKERLFEYLNDRNDTLENICEYNPDLYEYLAEQKGYHLNRPGETPELREWLITKYQQRFDEIHEIIKTKSKYWAKVVLKTYQETVQWAEEQKKVKELTYKEIVKESIKRVQPFCNIANNILLNWIAFWRYQNLIKEKKLNKIYLPIFENKSFNWHFALRLEDLIVTENWKEIANYLDPVNIAWLPDEIANLIDRGIITIGKKGMLFDENKNEITPDKLKQIIENNFN